MADFISNGGCFNGARYARDGAGQGARDWIAATDADVTGWVQSRPIIVSASFDCNDMGAIDGDFELQWRNVTDAGTFANLTATGEVKWTTGTDLINDNAVVDSERGGSQNCSGMGVDGSDEGVERSGANAIDLVDIPVGIVLDHQWAVSFVDGDPGDEYEFRIVETGTSNSYGTFAGTVTIVAAVDIIGVTKDKDGVTLGSVFVAVFEKVEGGGPPHDYIFRGKTTSDPSTGAYTIADLAGGAEHFIYMIKEDTPHVMDATDDVLTGV